jgi:carbon monoxide dehydrogenase subunit G
VDLISASISLDLPREEVFEYLSDIANHAEFSDHYLVDWRLTREDSRGAGAGARFRMKQPLNRFAWGDLTIVDLQRPFRIVLRGRGGKFNRIKMVATYELHLRSGGGTDLTYTFENDASMPSDALRWVLLERSWTRRGATRAVRRLRAILEDGSRRGSRPTVAAG